MSTFLHIMYHGVLLEKAIKNTDPEPAIDTVFTFCSVLKSSYIGISLDLYRDNVQLLFGVMDGQVPSFPDTSNGVGDVKGASRSGLELEDTASGVVEGVGFALHEESVERSVNGAMEALPTPPDLPKRLFVTGSGGPGDMVAAHLGGVRLQGPAIGRRDKMGKTNVPSVLVTQLGQLFVAQSKAAQIDKENQKNRATASQDPKVRKRPSSVATPEEILRAKKFKTQRKAFLTKEVEAIVKRLEGDMSGCVCWKPNCSVGL